MSDEPTVGELNQVSKFIKGAAPNLTIFEWHKLLRILEREMQVCNMDTREAVHLWERISTQLHGEECIVTGSEKDRRLYPDRFVKKEEPVKIEETTKRSQKSLWDRIWGR
jgi:hypothetical protein